MSMESPEQQGPVVIPGPVMRLFLTGFEDGQAFDGPGGTRCMPLRFHSGETVVEVNAPVENIEQIIGVMQRAVARAKLTDGVPNGLIVPETPA